MADPALADPLATPPIDSDFFSDLPLSFSDNIDDIDFIFDDINLPSDTEDFFISLPIPANPTSDLDSTLFSSDSGEISAVSGDVAEFLNVPSSPGPASSQGSGDSGNYVSKTVKDTSRVSDYLSPGPASSHRSQNSGNSVFVSDLSNNSTNGVVDQKVKLEEELGNSLLKRKKENANLENSDFSELRTSKYRKPNVEGINEISDEDEKRKARLMRNRESAQLSRQRKKHYVEELEDKVRAMHSTIQDLNSKISYIMAENASLRQQANGMPPPGMYAPSMGYPRVPCPPYMVKPQGSQVPLVPIPRLKPQQPAPAPKIKKNESKKSENKTKKVASVSFLGLLFFMVLFGGFVPLVNVKFREMHESVTGRLESNRDNNRVLTSVNSSDRDVGIGKGQCGNLSEPLVASLYVPRNDKLVKIDGNLIIHSVMASEKAMASSRDKGVKNRNEETGLAVARNNMPNIIPLTGRNRHPQPYRGTTERQRALSGEKSPTDGKLQQWFREGLAGPMLSSGMCTEVFQFDVSPAAGAIVPATSLVNASSEEQYPKNITTNLLKGKNRRILGAPVPLVGSESNITEKPVGVDSEKDNFIGNKSLSSMVVSVLVDPRETGDGDGEGIMGSKSISRIFVVVLIDSVRYVTYSCMLPLIGSGAHLVTN